MTPAEIRYAARGHAARSLLSSLDTGWPDAYEFGYTEAEAAAIAREIQRIAERMSRR